MVREDLIQSAISFLQDPSVAQAPIEKKIAFLQSKNLTQEEIDVALSRVGDGSATVAPVAAGPGGPPANYQYRPPYPQQGGYAPYPPYGFQQPPPEVPKRDWRDWFIMATVMGGVGYGIYFTAKRYIIPLIAPPTPPQLEQDKQTIDQSFEKAFALLDQLSTDTEELKAAEKSRTERLDTALSELESVLSALRESEKKRDDESKRNADEIRGLRELIPKAMEGQKEATDTRLKNLGEELKSLSKLISNRVGGSNPAPSPTTTAPAGGRTLNSFQTNGTSSTTTTDAAPSTNGQTLGSTPQPQTESSSTPAEGSRSGTPTSISRFGSGGGKASIPAWQMAAAKKAEEKKDTSASGTAVDATSA